MENNKESGPDLSFWLPGGAVLISLMISTFVLHKEPFINARPASPPSMTQPPIDARLWQDPFDALARYRDLHKESRPPAVGENANSDPCESRLDRTDEAAPQVMVALVRTSDYADQVEMRRRIRYAILAGLKTSRRVPVDEGHIQCVRPMINGKPVDVPYETFAADPFDPPLDNDRITEPTARLLLLWVDEASLGKSPLKVLDGLRISINDQLNISQSAANLNPMKVIGPASSKVLRDLYHEEALLRASNVTNEPSPLVEIYSPLATAERSRLMEGTTPPGAQALREHPGAMKLLRTVSDDGTMAALLLDELVLRHVNPALGILCARPPAQNATLDCPQGRWEKSNRVAIVAEWDSFYSRALIESFTDKVAVAAGLVQQTGSGPETLTSALTIAQRQELDPWVMQFGYLRGIDGRIPDKNPSTAKIIPGDKSASEALSQETADGNGQLDYMRRLADHIADLDKAQRDSGGNGIGAIGIFGQDTYDKLMVLQALKSRMPTKVYFSTDLDARMLQPGQAKITRNLVLAAPYGLSLTRALQQDVPPFRESLQSSVYVAVLAALAPQPFDAKRWKFDYATSSLHAPSIYEVGASGFIPLASQLTERRPEDCSAGSLTDNSKRVRPQDIMALQCLQDRSPPPYAQVSPRIQEWLAQAQSFFFAGPLCVLLVFLALALACWRKRQSQKHGGEKRAGWAQRLPLVLYASAIFSTWLAMRYWQVEWLWCAGVLVALGALCAGLTRLQLHRQAVDDGATDLQAAKAAEVHGSSWHVIVPLLLFAIVLLWGYAQRASLTADGLGEPMFLFEGISSWPTAALRLLASIISVAALSWAWRKLDHNRREIEFEYCLTFPKWPTRFTLYRQWRLQRGQRRRGWPGVWTTFSSMAYRILLPLSQLPPEFKLAARRSSGAPGELEIRRLRLVANFWREHRIAGSLGARMIRVLLSSWMFLVVTSAFYVIMPVEDIPVRGSANGIWLWSWVLATVTFQILAFFVVDTNLLLTRFIRQLKDHQLIWPKKLRAQWMTRPVGPLHPCFDDYMGINLIAKRTSAVNRLIYAPTLVMLVLIASRSAVFDNWPAPLSTTLILILNVAILLGSALYLRRCAENARRQALANIDLQVLKLTDIKAPTRLSADGWEIAVDRAEVEKQLGMLRQRIKDLRTGAFSPYSEEPLIRAVMVSLTGLGGSAVLEALNALPL
ncbi:hypothetical protein [Pseudomonas sp. dw_358]|uniref:hypothetical protein n=1 Tax=Pseudomonas sp. dw_358 TaxID=2720083 RepID=UPI001BD641C5|nr:hypothetical protein [Pseudomonas sp. dw_358]